ncbi:LysR family transcriptional regulator, partial [Salinisphaera hydrothermalis]
MSPIPRTTVEQWAILRVVVEHNGFARAAEHLNKSQSSISYAVARLQERLGVELLALDGRRAVLTEAGRMLLDEAGPLVDEWMRLEQSGRAMGGGHEARIRLRVDSLFSKARLFAALQVLEQQYELYASLVYGDLIKRRSGG